MIKQFVMATVTFLIVFLEVHGEPTLRLVNLVYRHGDRSPIEVFPKDPIEASRWPNGLGWLSEEGMKQQYNLGQWLRSRYGSFLNPLYDHREINVTSSDEERCLMSAECNLAGLYPLVENKTDWPVPFQPIPIHTKPKFEDKRISMNDACPKYDQLYAAELDSKKVQDVQAKYQGFFNFLDVKTGQKNSNVSNIWTIADCLFCEKSHNFTDISPWADIPYRAGETETAFQLLKQINDFAFRLLSDGEKARFKGGPLLKEMIMNMQQTQKGEKYPKMYMHSGHDTTVAAFLTTLGAFEGRESPQYASTVLVELYQKEEPSKKFFVRVFYKNETFSEEAHSITVKGCDSADCDFEQFLEAVKHNIPDDWDKECGKTPAIVKPSKYSTSTIVNYILGGLLLICMVALVIILVSMKRRRNQHPYGQFDVQT